MSPNVKSQHTPIFLLLLISLLVGIFTFQDYGMTWDEGLYYGYGEAIGYAYSIPERLSDDFDINRAYGPSISDHRNRGPAYLLFSRIPVKILHAVTGVDIVALWHLINFITFLIGVFYLYKLSLRWLNPLSAFAASLLYISQPLLWGHAFINPKDPPFTTIFVAAIYYGFRMVDQLVILEASEKVGVTQRLRQIALTGILIGLATNLRIIAPLIGILIFIYALMKRKPKILIWFLPTALIALLVVYLSWPYLWDAPIARFVEVLTLMSHNPTTLKVLFYGNVYRAYELPLRYLPYLAGTTLTEPVWPLFIIGLGGVVFRFLKKKLEWQTLGIVIFWFVFLVTYVLTIRPPMYDGYRHFLFILPPVFIVTGFAFEMIFAGVRANWLRIIILFSILLIGLYGGLKLHPYEYTYYNSFVGGTSGAEGSFETEYWLTCYKEAVEVFSEFAPKGATLITYREATIAAYYAPDNINIIPIRPLKTGDYLLLSARLDETNTVKRHSPNIIAVGRDGATFCVIKEIQ